MDTIHFLGRISPPDFNVTINPPRTLWRLNHFRTISFYTVSVTSPEIDILCEIPQFKQEYMIHLYFHAFDLVRIPVDLMAFASGSSVTTVIDYIVMPDGTKTPIWLGDDDLAETCTSFRLNAPHWDTRFWEILQIVYHDVALFMALRDLVEANSTPHVATINCGRVLDGIRTMISPEIDKSPSAWRVMQEALNISEPYQKWVSNLPAKPRRADRTYQTGDDVREAFKRTWTIMNRYLAFRRQGKIPLTAPEFPKL